MPLKHPAIRFSKEIKQSDGKSKLLSTWLEAAVNPSRRLRWVWFFRFCGCRLNNSFLETNSWPKHAKFMQSKLTF